MYDTPDLEDTKAMLLRFLSDVKNLDITSTPNYYFCVMVYTHLKTLGNCFADHIVANISVDFSGLGVDYEPHQQFLNEAAKSTAIILNNIWCNGLMIGEEYALTSIKAYSVHIK
jgi:hypothetical protein